MRTLPTPNGPGSSQDRVQAAILARATNFLQKNMFPLQVWSDVLSHFYHSLPHSGIPQFIPKPTTSKGKQPNGATSPNGTDSTIDKDSELAMALQPLLEQEALLESFIDEAKAQRKFEDVKTLRSNHAEIKREIERVVNASDSQGR